MISIASIAQSALLDLAFVFSGLVVEGGKRHKILKRLDREAVQTVRKAAREGGILVLKF